MARGAHPSPPPSSRPSRRRRFSPSHHAREHGQRDPSSIPPTTRSARIARIFHPTRPSSLSGCDWHAPVAIWRAGICISPPHLSVHAWLPPSARSRSGQVLLASVAPPPAHFSLLMPHCTRPLFSSSASCAPPGPVVGASALALDGEEEEFSDTATLLTEDDGADAAAVVQAHVHVLMAVRRRARTQRIARQSRCRGSTTGRRGNKLRDFAAGLQGILRDYFGVRGLPPIYNSGTSGRGSVSLALCSSVSTLRSRASSFLNSGSVPRASFKRVHYR